MQSTEDMRSQNETISELIVVLKQVYCFQYLFELLLLWVVLLFDLTKVVHDLEHFLVSGRASKIVNLFDLVALGIDILRDKHLEQTSKGIQYFLLAELAVFVYVNLVHLVY